MEKDRTLNREEIVTLYNDDNFFRISRINPLLTKYIKKERGKSALDIGCGNGTNAKYLKEMGYKVLAVDINETAIKLAKSNGVDAVLEDIKEFKWKNSYDLIISFYSLQHISREDGKKVLVRASRKLNQNGLIIISIFMQRRDCVTKEDLKQYLTHDDKLALIDENEWYREDSDHGESHIHQGYYCIIKRIK